MTLVGGSGSRSGSSSGSLPTPVVNMVADHKHCSNASTLTQEVVEVLCKQSVSVYVLKTEICLVA